MTEVPSDKIALPARRANRPVTVMHRVEYAATRGLMGLFKALGVDRASALAGGFMRAVGPLIGSIHQRGVKNLKRVHPDWSDEKIAATLKDVWENLGRTTAEFPHFDAFQAGDPQGRLCITGAEHIAPYVIGKKPVILVTGHFANWEVAALVARQAGMDFAIVYRAANNPLVDELIINARAAAMTRVQIPKGKPGALAFMDALKKGRSLALLVDQKFNEGISVPLMGHPAMSAPAPARAAIRFNLPIIPVSTVRREGAYFDMIIHPAIHPAPTGDIARDVYALTEQLNQFVERQVEAYPGQWLWLHRRWGKI